MILFIVVNTRKRYILRVIAGKYRGRKLISPDGQEIRPTTDRVKENVFNLISLKLPGSNFLDLFAGSGGIGIEAISRGSEKTVFVDKSQISIACLKENLEKLKVNEGHIIYCEDSFNIISKLEVQNEKFDIIYLDPPYKTGIYQEAIKKIAEADILSEDGIVVSEHSVEDVFSELPESFILLKEKKYGSIVVSIYKRK